MTYKDKKVFVTGGSGFIGSHLVRKLKELGSIVIGTEHRTELHGVDYVVEADVRDALAISEAMNVHRPDFVFHLAAEAIVTEAQNKPITAFSTNVMGTVNVLAACRAVSLDSKHEFRGIVVASSDKVYGRHKDMPYSEGHELRGWRQFYEASKVAADYAARSFVFDGPLPIAITRFGNVYGPGDTHINSRLIPQTILAFMRGEELVIRSDGQQKRDYLYIDDVVDAYLSLGLYRRTGMYHIFNFGNEHPMRVLDVVAAIREHFPNAKNPKITNQAKDEIPVQYLDSLHARNELGWTPVVGFREGIAKTVEWYKEAYA